MIPANNRGRKSLATIYWLLANEILKDKDSKPVKYEIDEFETKTVEVEEEL